MTTFRTTVELAGKTATGFEVPDEVVAEVDVDDPQAQQFFESLSYSNKRRHTLSVDGAKTDATRARRIAKAVEDLRAGKK